MKKYIARQAITKPQLTTKLSPKPLARRTANGGNRNESIILIILMIVFSQQSSVDLGFDLFRQS